VPRAILVATVLFVHGVGCQRSHEPQATTGGGSAMAATDRPAAAVHPLDPLTADEIRTAIRVARADARLGTAAFPSVALQQPAKADVTAWPGGGPLVRRARLEAMTADGAYELVVDLAARRVLGTIERTAGEPSITLREILALEVVLSNEDFKAGLRKRGITDPGKVFCAPFSAGY
jgi:primary-amine oxidase